MEKYWMNIPVALSAVTEETFPVYVEKLHKMGANRVFLTLITREWLFGDDTSSEDHIRKYIAAFSAAGFEVGIWISGFGFGGAVKDAHKEMADRLTHITSITGKVAGDAYCPTDETFLQMYKNWVIALIKCGAKMIMLDDDLCLSVRPGIGCACDTHLSLLQEKLGKTITREEIVESFCGKSNRIRSAFIGLMGETMRRFCKEIRAAVDSVDPSVRLGYCAGFTSWDLEGADPIDLSRILAGNTKPFFRFMGAPYWVTRNRFDGQRLATIIESVRMQYAWCKEADIEVFSENDSWPRPRYHAPAAYCEIFDLALRTAGEKNTLKYVFDYFASPETETGYIKAFEKHENVRRKIAHMFDGMAEKGIRVFEYTDKTADMELPSSYIGDYEIMQRAFSPAACMLTQHAIPTVYAGKENVGIVFGANAKQLKKEEIGTGLILDLPAAKLLQEKGIDVGLHSFEETGFIPDAEVFPKDKDVCRLFYANGVYYNAKLKDSASVLSYFQKDAENVPAVYLYENADGIRFMVFCFDAYSVHQNSDVFLSYRRGMQIKKAMKWLGSAIVPAVSGEHPGLYMICKEDGEKQAIALFNICEDSVFDLQVKVENGYALSVTIACTAKMENGTVLVEDEIHPFGFIGLLLEKK